MKIRMKIKSSAKSVMLSAAINEPINMNFNANLHYTCFALVTGHPNKIPPNGTLFRATAYYFFQQRQI